MPDEKLLKKQKVVIIEADWIIHGVMFVSDTGICNIGETDCIIHAVIVVSDTGICNIGETAALYMLLLLFQTLVSVTLERLTALYMPLKVRIVFSKRRATLGLILLAIFIGLLNTNFLINYSIIEIASDEKVC